MRRQSAVIAPGGDRIARLAAGGCVAAADAVLGGAVDNAYALVRPCGHHAETDRGRGFCVFGNVAVAVLHAREAHGVARVTVVDFDVHHGNGTQDAFYREPSGRALQPHQEAVIAAAEQRLSVALAAAA